MRITRSLLVLATFDSNDGLVGSGQTMAQLILRERLQFLTIYAPSDHFLVGRCYHDR
jgi:hypothetical protein